MLFLLRKNKTLHLYCMVKEDSVKDLCLLSWSELAERIPEPPSRIKAVTKISSPTVARKEISRPIPVRTSISVQQGSLQLQQLITYQIYHSINNLTKIKY